MLSLIGLPNGRIHAILNCFISILCAAALAALVSKHLIHDHGDLSKCRVLLERGRWSHDFESHSPHVQWHPEGCMLRTYNATDTSDCIKKLTIIGDSTARRLFWALARRLKRETKVSTSNLELSPQIAKHTNMTLNVGNAREIHFIWDPYLNKTHPSMMPAEWSRTVVVSAGLWQARYLDDSHLASFEEQGGRLVGHLHHSRNNATMRNPAPASVFAPPIFLPISHPVVANLDTDRATTLTPNRTLAINENLRLLAKRHAFEVMWAALPMTAGHPSAFEAGGLHVTEMIASQQLDVLLNRLCNARVQTGPKHTCCSSPEKINNVQAVIFGFSLYLSLFWMRRLLSKKSTRHVGQLLKSCTTMAAVSIYTFAADRTSVFETVNKLVDEQAFLMACGLSVLIGFVSISRIQSSKLASEDEKEPSDCGILPRQQTEEWKGWMQIVILLYHYFGVSSTIWAYRLVRVLVASYLFLTGYGHAQYFIKTNDFSLRRVLAVLVRLNLLSCILPFIMNTRYDFYYFPTLSSTWFIVTWATLRSQRGYLVNMRRTLTAIVLSATALELVLQSQGLQTACFALLRRAGMLSIDQYEFAFRTRLDRFVPYTGMITALVQSQYEESLFKASHRISHRSATTALLGLSSLLAAAGYAYWAGRYINKQAFNAIHPFTSWIPILSFVVLRNIAPGTRNRYSRIFAWVGRHSLETYILQHHIWLAADAKGLLRLGVLDGWLIHGRTTISSSGFWIEALLLTLVFLWVSSAVSAATSNIVRWFVSEGNTADKGLRMDLLQPTTRPGDRLIWYRLRSSLRNGVGIRMKVSLFILLLWQLNLMW